MRCQMCGFYLGLGQHCPNCRPSESERPAYEDGPMFNPHGSSTTLGPVDTTEPQSGMPDQPPVDPAVRDLLVQDLRAHHAAGQVVPKGSKATQSASFQRPEAEPAPAAPSEKLQRIPCARCGGPCVEFTVPNDVWNAIVRKGGKERDDEYICEACYRKAVEVFARTAIERERLANMRADQAEEARDAAQSARAAIIKECIQELERSGEPQAVAALRRLDGGNKR